MVTDFSRRLRAYLRTGLVVTAATGAAIAGGLLQPASAGVHAQTLPAGPGTGQTSCATAGDGLTCSNTFSGDTAYDPTTASQMTGLTPSVTVDQTQNLTNQMVHITWNNFTPSFSANGSTAVDPTILSNIFYGVAIFQCSSPTPNYEGFYGQTNGLPVNQCYPVWDPSQATAGPRNGIITVTRPGTADTSPNSSTVPSSCSTAKPGDTVCGTGAADFQIETAEDNSALGCSSSHACSIVVMPMWGGWDGNQGVLPNPPTDPNPPSYPADPVGQENFTYDCSVHDYQGSPLDSVIANMQNWGDSCAWADRIVIPITFAPTPASYCPANAFQFTAEGSPPLEQAMNQWRTGWCKGGQNPITFDYNSTVDEYRARSDFLSNSAVLTENADIALVTRPASSDLTSASQRHFTYAPIAVTGISVAYYVDNVQTGQQITDLKLNARLVAKLLTESYSQAFYEPSNNCQTVTAQTQNCDPAVANNPQNIFSDPEFLALNPQYTTADFNNDIDGNTAPLVLAGNSDMTYEITRWIESDPDARSFLEGKADPWGMHVNNYFKVGQTYPVDEFIGLDPGFVQTIAQALNDQPGYSETMQATWNPISELDNVVARMAIWQSSAVTYNPVCPALPCNGTNAYTNAKAAPQLLGDRTLFAIVDQGSAATYRLPTAKLLNAAGSYVAPTTDSMTAAVAAMNTNADKITQYPNFSSGNPAVYPLTEVQYAMVPTCGLTAGKARAISSFLTNVTTSQIYGTAPGQLPSFGGYLTLNATQKAQDLTAAQSVSTQSCTSPPPNPPGSGSSAGTGTGSGTGTGTSGQGLNPSSPASSPGGTSIPGSTTPTVGAQGGQKTPTGSANSQQPVGLGTKSGDDNGFAHYILPIALAVGAVFALGGPIAYLFGTGAVSMPYGRKRSGGPSEGGGDE